MASNLLPTRTRSRSKDSVRRAPCIGGCGFYGAAQLQGLCSQCYASRSECILENDKALKTSLAAHDPTSLADLEKCKRLADGESIDFQGDEDVHTLKNAAGHVYCTCPSWRYQKKQPTSRTCKHIRIYLKAHSMSPADAGIIVDDRPLVCGALVDGASMQVQDLGETYRIEYSDGLLQCSCPAWVYQHRFSDTRTCKHVRDYLKEHGLSPSEGGIILVGRPAKCGILADGEFVHVRGASDTYYIEFEDGFLHCSCPAWKYQRLASDGRTCKHVDAYLKDHGLTYEEAGLCIDSEVGVKPDGSKSPSRRPRDAPRSPIKSSKPSGHTSTPTRVSDGPVVDMGVTSHLEYSVVRESDGPWDTVLISESGSIYVLQLLQHHPSGSFFVWTREGRCESENSILHPVESLSDGKATFDCKYFEKTGNRWSFGRDFKRHTGMYVLLGMP